VSAYGLPPGLYVTSTQGFRPATLLEKRERLEVVLNNGAIVTVSSDGVDINVYLNDSQVSRVRGEEIADIRLLVEPTSGNTLNVTVGHVDPLRRAPLNKEKKS
jgi:hypothetical protein